MKLSEAIAALERGEEVEWKEKDKKEWVTFDKLVFDEITTIWLFDQLSTILEYRLKQKSMEIWLNIDENGAFWVHESKESAKKFASLTAKRIAVHFREVIGES